MLSGKKRKQTGWRMKRKEEDDNMEKHGSVREIIPEMGGMRVGREEWGDVRKNCEGGRRVMDTGGNNSKEGNGGVKWNVVRKRGGRWMKRR